MAPTPTKKPQLTLRLATPENAGLVLEFMKKLGAYQKMSDAIIATEASLRRLLELGLGSALLGYCDDQVVSMLFFNDTCSAFTGRSGVFIDALYVDEGYRQHGFGKVMMEHLCARLQESEGQLVEWGCLDWNASAIAFYTGLGAYCVDTMRIYRLPPESIKDLAAQA